MMVEGVSGMLSVARRQRRRVKWEPSLGQLTWPGGSDGASCFRAIMPTGCAGPSIISPGATSWPNGAQADGAWDNLQMGLRRGTAAAGAGDDDAAADAAARADPSRIRGRWRPAARRADNVNLPSKFRRRDDERPMAGRGSGRQELDGELIAESREPVAAGADRAQPRRRARRTAARSDRGRGRSAGGRGEGCDACGIVVAGRARDRLYVLADESVPGLSPDGWARRSRRRRRGGTRTGGRRGEQWRGDGRERAEGRGRRGCRCGWSMRRTARWRGPSRSRFGSRAGGRISRGDFRELEDELAGLTAGGGYEGPGRSPDRADAMVWAMTELSETRSGVPRVRAALGSASSKMINFTNVAQLQE